MSTQMTDEEAKKEHDEIQAQIAKEKGEKDAPVLETEAPPPDKLDEKTIEPQEDKDVKNKDVPEDTEGDEADDSDLVDPEKKTSRRIPLSKFQDLKKKSKGQIEALEKQVAELSSKLDSKSTEKSISEKVKTLSEQTGISEEALLQIIQVGKESAQIDPKTLETIKSLEIKAQKDDARASHEAEIQAFITEFPEAKDSVTDLRKKSLEDSNLNKTLYEVYHRYVKTPEITVEKKITGERSRGGRDITPAGINFQKIADDVKNNVPNTLGKLTPEQQDQFFTWAEKTGSRYTRK